MSGHQGFDSPTALGKAEPFPMITRSEKALLPAGMSDRLPPEADLEDSATESILNTFRTYGYQRVKPPLLEFEENLLSGNGQGLSKQTFRLMDPISQRMMGLRADATTQIARIATTRLIKQERPLRLSYRAEVLRVSGTQLRPERQFRQVGAELIGTVSPLADVEVILMAIAALKAIGIEQVSVDLAVPTLVPRLALGLGLSDDLAIPLRDALDRKDAADVQALTNSLNADQQVLFRTLLDAVGQAGAGIQMLQALNIPDEARQLLGDLSDVIAEISKNTGDKVTLTVDPVDNRGFEYHAGVTFTLFARGVRGELCSGGRYHSEPDEQGHWEACTGLTVFMDSVLRALPAPKMPDRLLIAADTPEADAESLRNEGWVVARVLDSCNDLALEARRLGYTHYLGSDGPTKT